VDVGLRRRCNENKYISYHTNHFQLLVMHSPVKNRSGVYVACIRSVMLYGAESWALIARLENILRCCDR
jgi:hypothetical protein